MKLIIRVNFDEKIGGVENVNYKKWRDVIPLYPGGTSTTEFIGLLKAGCFL